jgi:elongator complex protein 6
MMLRVLLCGIFRQESQAKSQTSGTIQEKKSPTNVTACTPPSLQNCSSPYQPYQFIQTQPSFTPPHSNLNFSSPQLRPKMSTRNRTPPLLEPYLRLPPHGSQLLLTGVLDSTPHWLVTRLLRSAFVSSSTSATSTSTPETEEAKTTQEEENIVVLVSWLRDFEFWKTEARRGAGIDLGRLAMQERFVFVDGLTRLFDGEATGDKTAKEVVPQSTQRSLPVRNTPATPVPSRGPLPSRGPVPSRGVPVAAPSQPQTQQAQPQAQQPATQAQQPQQATKQIYLTSPSPTTTLSTLNTLLSSLSTAHPNRKIHLILDSPTLLLSVSASPSATTLSSLLLSLRSLVSTSTLVLQTDSPFLTAAQSSQTSTPLEAAHAAFVVQQAHVSEWVVSLRALDTGKARDVSGVVRVCRGGAWDDGEAEEGEKKELEALYFVQGDGGVRVFERGEASVG